MAELICTRCRHRKTAHSRVGCREWLLDSRGIPTGVECKCKVKYTEESMFMQGTPKEG